MGRASIMEHLGDGRYTIELDFGSQRLQYQLQLFADANTQIDTKLATEETKRSNLYAELVPIDAAVTAAVNAYVAQVNAEPNNAQTQLDALTRAKETQARKEAEIAAVQRAIDVLNFDKQKNLQQIALYDQARQTLTKNAWCTDYTTDATGEVATIDIPGDPNLTLICPGGRSPTNADGEFLSRASMTGAQAFYNAAIFPGWQKFKPTYRAGTITGLNFANNTANVSLYPTTSMAQDLNVNQTETLSNVPVEYMDNNAEAFEIDDACVVQFVNQDWEQPKVIGFLENPVDAGKEPFLLLWQKYPNRATANWLSKQNATYYALGFNKNNPSSWYLGDKTRILTNTFKVNDPDWYFYYPTPDPSILYQINDETGQNSEIYFLFVWSEDQNVIDAAKDIVENGLKHYYDAESRFYIQIISLDKNLFPKPKVNSTTKINFLPSAFNNRPEEFVNAYPYFEYKLTWGFVDETYNANPPIEEDGFRVKTIIGVNEDYYYFNLGKTDFNNFDVDLVWGPFNQFSFETLYFTT